MTPTKFLRHDLLRENIEKIYKRYIFSSEILQLMDNTNQMSRNHLL